LAAARLANDGQRFIFFDLERYAAHRRVPLSAYAELGDQVPKFKGGRCCRHNYSERSLGSMASRNASPNRFRARTVSRIARLGNTVSHHASRMFSKPSRIMLPQVAVGGGTPRPMKLSEASVRMAEAIHRDPSTTTSEIMFGTICTPIRRKGP